MLLSLIFVLVEPAVLVGIESKPNTFSYAELRSATKDFDPSNKLGEGGYGPVYKVTIYLLRLQPIDSFLACWLCHVVLCNQ